MRQPPAEYGRLYALGLLVLTLGLLYGIGMHWWWTAPMLSMESQMEDLRQQELQARMDVKQRPQIEKRLADVRKLEAENPGFLPEATVELAQAGLTQRIESQIAEVSPDHAACTIVQRTPTPWAGTPERYQRVLVQVRLLCGMNELSALLHAFEGGRPQLFIGNLNIISQHGFNPETQLAESTVPLNISFDLYGYLRPGTATPHAH